MARYVALELGAVGGKVRIGLDPPAMAVEGPAERQRSAGAEGAIGPPRVGELAGKGEVGAQQDDLAATHLHGEIHGGMNDAAARVQHALGERLPQLLIHGAAGVGGLARPLPGQQGCRGNRGVIDQGGLGRLGGGQPVAVDGVIYGDDDVGPDAVAKQKRQRGIDADQQVVLPTALQLGLQGGQVVLQGRAARHDQRLLALSQTKQGRHIAVAGQQIAVFGQPPSDVGVLGIEPSPGERQVYFTHQPVADAGGGIFHQQQLGRQGEEGQPHLAFVAGHHQLDPGIRQPILLVQQPQHQGKQGAIHDLHFQPLEAAAPQQGARQIAKPGAVEVQHRLLGQAGGLQFGLLHPVVPAGELDAVEAEGGAEPLGQLGRQAFHVLCQQAGPEGGPALADEPAVLVEEIITHRCLSTPSSAVDWRSSCG